MLEWMLFRVIMVASFILATSFFVAAEFALVGVRDTRIQQLIALGRPGARTALKLKHSIDEFLPAVQLGVTVAGLALGWMGEYAIAEMILSFVTSLLHRLPTHAVLYAHTIAVVIAFSAITYFEVLLGELVPKSLALQRAERIALAVAGPMDVFIRMTRPAVRLMNYSAALVLRLFRAPLRGEGSVHSPEELKLIATATPPPGSWPTSSPPLKPSPPSTPFRNSRPPAARSPSSSTSSVQPSASSPPKTFSSRSSANSKTSSTSPARPPASTPKALWR